MDRKQKIFLMTGLGIVVYVGIKYLLAPVIPFLLGWLLACWISPLARWFERKLRIKRGVAGGILVGTSIIGIGWLLLFLGNLLLRQMLSLKDWIMGWSSQRNLIYNQCCQAVERYIGIEQGDVYQFLVLQEEKLGKKLQNTISTQGLNYFVDVLKSGIFIVSSVLVVVIFSVLLIKDMESFQVKIQKIPAARVAWRIGKNIGKAGGKYLKAQGEIMLVVGLVCVLGLWILGNSYFLLWGILIGVLDALPVLGVGIILIPWAVIWLIRGNYGLALGYFVLFLVADLVRQFLEPKILGKEMGIHPALMLASVYGGIFLYGVAGFVLGPVSVLIYRNIWKEIKNFKEK